jgi:ribonuclease BN (tRNA processing enzyme)
MTERFHVITLGTAGGPRVWGGQRAGISTAIVVDDSFYLVDVGHSSTRQIERAGLSIRDLRGIFITHMHSDHLIDLAALSIFGIFDREGLPPVPIFGPGDRGMLPPVSKRAVEPPQPVFADDPTPGVTGAFRHLMAAYATDLNDRILDALRPSPFDCFAPHDIVLPPDIGYDANTASCPDMAPFLVFEDRDVRVTATLVEHPPIAPAFAFRFDAEPGSVTISGDTAPTSNLERLAAGSDLLLHEAIDFGWVHRRYPGSDPLSVASVDHHRHSHSAPQDVARLAARAGVGALALHHLVPGNASPEAWQISPSDYAGPVLVPDDLQSIPIGRG